MVLDTEYRLVDALGVDFYGCLLGSDSCGRCLADLKTGEEFPLWHKHNWRKWRTGSSKRALRYGSDNKGRV